MRLILKDFQEEKTTELLEKLRSAAREAKRGEHQAVVLSSPTGSGKTIMATSAIERLVAGDDRIPPRREARFLWITDQPELNEQTRRKILDASSLIGPSKLLVVGSSFDQQEFAPGVVHFLNTQKLGREKVLVTSGDKRTYTLWDTVTNTAKKYPDDFFVIIDEAHRGMFQSPRARREANSIIQRFIKGHDDLDPVPIILGISATPERFQELVRGSGRTTREVEVPVEAVRASGLLKDILTVYRPTAKQATDLTMLIEASKQWKTFATSWVEYTAKSGDFNVSPILVIQVEDGSKTRISRTDTVEAIGAIQDAVGPLPAEAFAHSFQEGGQLTLDGLQLRYLAPPDIDSDPEVRVIFFKTSLSTGWDCPRAEVMMSFRRAVDATFIAQLVGRMVRNPLARRIESNEFLNTVALYLPHYDEKGLRKVVESLTRPQAELLPSMDVELAEDISTLVRRPRSGRMFDTLSKVPSYVIPTTRPVSQVRRLMKFGRLLANEGVEQEAPEKALASLLRVLATAYRSKVKTKKFKAIIERTGQVEIEVEDFPLWDEEADESGSVVIDLAEADADTLFEAAGRKIGEGLHKAWWKKRMAEDSSSKVTAKLEFFALMSDPTIVEKMQRKAQDAVQQWMRNHRAHLDSFTGSAADALDEIRQLAVEPEQIQLYLPDVIEAKSGKRKYEKHLYVDGSGNFTATLNKWERKAIEHEIGQKDVIGWLRNMDRKRWSFRVPYLREGRYWGMYPDFLVVRKTGRGPVVDILDPHTPELSDAAPKAVGLAQFAAKHAHSFGRIQLILVEKDVLKRLELTDERVRKRVLGVTSREGLKDVFATAG